MSGYTKRIFTNLVKPPDILLIPSLALKRVTSKDGKQIFASSDTLYKDAIFGRDTCEVADDLLRRKPRLIANSLITLASLQGEVLTMDNDEEPGKIVHEYRNIMMGGKRINKISLEIFQRLSTTWGGTDVDMAYYGSIDSTPHFLRVLYNYCQQYGDKLLDVEVPSRRGGPTLTMRERAKRATAWLVASLAESQSGLLEWVQRSPNSFPNQAWKDSEEFYVHTDGEMANHEAPISSIEVQGITYDALLAAAEYHWADPELCQQIAEKIRQRTIDLLWMPERNYFALGTDFSKDGRLRIIRTITANPAALLDTRFFDTLARVERQKYVTAITEVILSRDFLTDAGIRSRALHEADLISFWDYHGSFVSWPKETYDIAKGLRRQGMPTLCMQLENRLLNIVLKHREYMEFVYVDEHGRVLMQAPRSHSHGDLFMIDSADRPERIQAWTVSAINAIVSDRFEQTVKLAPKNTQEPWQAELEKRMYTNMPRVNAHLNPFALSARYPTYRYKLARQREQ